ncbi:MAG: efflux RND transporter periplasmic adaptor subunit [Gammaproteobacteria bacterium]|nr:efflux RND transporter periplasmic adaptor subunit [Gammaproteobacteria bacterium]
MIIGSPRHSILGLVLGTVALSAGLAGCSSGDGAAGAAAPARPPMPVSVLEMQPQRVPASVEVMAQTEGARETEVRARVGGILMKRLYQEGETVRAGQPLFQIDRASYEIALAEAKARADQAARELKRLEGLVEQNLVSRRDYDNAVSTHDIAQAALRQAQLNLSWTTVTAPVSGTTGRAIKSEGNLITTGADSLLTSIYQLDPIWVRFSLAESDIAKLPQGRLAAESITGIELVLPDGSVYPVRGKLNYMASTIDTALGTQQLRAEFANHDNRLLPGQFVRARLLLGDRENVYLVPQVAVVQNDAGRMVMVADAENKVTPRPVQTAEWRGQDWVITGGLQPGDRVITDNIIKLRPGMVVAPNPAPAPALAGDKAAPAKPAVAAPTKG